MHFKHAEISTVPLKKKPQPDRQSYICTFYYRPEALLVWADMVKCVHPSVTDYSEVTLCGLWEVKIPSTNDFQN